MSKPHNKKPTIAQRVERLERTLMPDGFSVVNERLGTPISVRLNLLEKHIHQLDTQVSKVEASPPILSDTTSALEIKLNETFLAVEKLQMDVNNLEANVACNRVDITKMLERLAHLESQVCSFNETTLVGQVGTLERTVKELLARTETIYDFVLDENRDFSIQSRLSKVEAVLKRQEVSTPPAPMDTCTWNTLAIWDKDSTGEFIRRPEKVEEVPVSVVSITAFLNDSGFSVCVEDKRGRFYRGFPTLEQALDEAERLLAPRIIVAGTAGVDVGKTATDTAYWESREETEALRRQLNHKKTESILEYLRSIWEPPVKTIPFTPEFRICSYYFVAGFLLSALVVGTLFLSGAVK